MYTLKKNTKFYTHTHTHTYVCIYFNLHKNTTSQSKFASHLVDDKGFEKMLISLGQGLQTIYSDHAKSYIIIVFLMALGCVMALRATSHTRVKALDHGNVRALIGRKGKDRPSTLHTKR